MNSSSSVRSVEVAVAGVGTVQAHIALPSEGTGPGLILLTDQSISGQWALQTAQLMAEEGYVTVAVDTRKLFDGLRTATHLNTAAAIVASVASLLADRAEMDGGIGLIGYGYGATVGCAAAAQGTIKCAILYSPHALADGSALPAPSVPTMVHFGANALADSVLARSAEALRGNPKVVSHSYPFAGSEFACEELQGYVRPAAMMAYSRSLGLLRKVLGPVIDLESLWEMHLGHEFFTKDPDATIATMVEDCYVNHVPNMTGGVGRRYLHRFYKHHFIPRTPDVEMIPVSRTIGVDRLVDEFVSIFTHDREIDWFLPGIPPTGKRLQVACVSIVSFRGRKLYNEHIYWDQASVFVQLGLLDPTKLPVAGVESVQKLLDKTRPSNELMSTWKNSEGLE